MRPHLFFILALVSSLTALAQQIEYVDDEACGCELVFIDGIQTTTDGNLFGFKRADGTIITPNRYKYVDHFHGDYCKVYLDDTLVGLIDRNGNEIVPCQYQDVNYPSDGRILFIDNYLRGYYDLHGHIAIPPSFPLAGDFSEHRAPIMVYLDSLTAACTFIDTLGNILYPPYYENIMPFNEGYAPVRHNGLWGLIDTLGHEVLPTRYENLTLNADGHFFAGREGEWALFDYSMQPLTPFIYSWSADIRDHRIPVSRGEKYGFLDLQGHEIIPCQYDEVGIFQQGRTLVRLTDHYGIIDTNGNIILPIEYSDRTPKGMKYMYFDSLALVEKDGKVGYVDLDGHLVIPFYFDEGYQFSEGLAAVKFKGRWGYIDQKGDIFMPFIFDVASPYEWGRAEVVYDGDVRKVDRRGKCVKNCKGIIAWREWKE